MLLNFDRMEEQLVPNPRGGEGQMRKRAFQNEDIQIMDLHLAPHSVIGLHPHTADSEMYYIVSGTGKVLCDGAYEPLSAGSVHYCPKGHEHSLINDSEDDLTFFAVVPEHGA